MDGVRNPAAGPDVWVSVSRLIADLRSGARMLIRYPTLSAAAILTLGLGIGASTTVFSVVNGALFKGLPFRDADRIVAIFSTNVAQRALQQPVNAQDLAVFRARQTVFARIGAYGLTAANLAAAGERPERFRAGLLTVDAFEALGVAPILGRGFREGDDRPGADPVILIGYQVWQQRYGGDGGIVGRPIRVDGVLRTVIGVMPERFAFPLRESLWTPLAVPAVPPPRAQAPAYLLVGRLKPGVKIAQADAQLSGFADALARESPATNQGIGTSVVPYSTAGLGPEIFALLYTMLGAGIGVLLIACVNVSNLLVARASLRRREVAVRMALGAGRARILRQQITEVAVLAAAGAGLGVLMSVWSMRWFVRALEVNEPPFWIRFDLDFRVMLFVLALIVVASLLAGVLPALQSARAGAAGALKDDTRSATSGPAAC
jgi:putative ABC transport system permease protein